MSTTELFTQIRELNVRALARALTLHPDAHVEPTFYTDDGDIAVDGPFDLPCRMDLIPVVDDEAGESVMVTPPTALSFDPLTVTLAGGVEFIVSPFGWDQAAFTVSLPVGSSLEPLLQWFWHWFDEADDNDPGPDGLYGVAHYLSDPEFAGGKLAFEVDFGSAPVEALDDLVAVLVEMGATRIEVAMPTEEPDDN